MFSNRFQELSQSVASCKYTLGGISIDEQKALYSAFEIIEKTRSQKGIIYVIGNGGSAGIASHFSTDLIKCLGIPSQTLYDSNLLTCLGNDYGYEQVFSYPLSKLLKKEDLLVAISSSGKSPNIVKAAEMTLEKQASLLTLSGFSEQNPLRKLGHLNFWIDRADYGLVETSHFFLLHTLIDFWNKRPTMEHNHAAITGNRSTKDQDATRNFATSR